MSFNELLFYYSPETCKLGCVSHASHTNPPPPSPHVSWQNSPKVRYRFKNPDPK